MTNIFEFRRNFSKGSGLYGNGDLLVFQRPANLQAWNFLEQIILNGKVGAIVGPRGVAKSITALAFASLLNRDLWTITWIHLRHANNDFVRFTLGKKFNGSFELSELENALYDDHKHILFLDGYSPNYQRWLGACHLWFESDRVNRRLVTISSMTTGTHDKRRVTFQTESWTLPEYVNAIESDIFFESI